MSDKLEGGQRVGKKAGAKRLFSLAGSPRHLLLPMTIVAVIDSLIDGVEDLPTPMRVELRCARAAILRAYHISGLASEVDLAWLQKEEDDEATDPALF